MYFRENHTAVLRRTNLTGDGAMIACDSSNTYRVCVNDHDASTLLTRSLGGDGHIAIFSSLDDHDAAVLRQWIFEGALFTP